MRLLVTGAAALLTATTAAAADLATMFAGRPAVMQAALSPDGDKVVFVSAYFTGGRVVRVTDVATGKTTIVMGGKDLSVQPRYCAFKGETRTICTVYGVFGTGTVLSSFNRVVAVDTDGRNTTALGENDTTGGSASRYGGDVIDWLPEDPDHALMQLRYGVATIDMRSGLARAKETSSVSFSDMGTDNHGEIRFRSLVQGDPSGYVRDRVTYQVRAKGSKTWLPLGKASISDNEAPSYLGFDETGDRIFRLAPHDGRMALYSVATDGSNAETLIYAHPTVDVEGVLRIGKYRRPVAATYTVERGEYEFFDQKLAALGRSLSKALPGHPAVSVLDESWDGTKKLVYADGDNVPGRYYILDGATKQLAELFSVYPALDGVTMGSVTPVQFTARDGTKIPGYLTLPPGRSDAKGLPGIVLPHGGPSARDSIGFDWLSQFLAASGYAVLQPNFRGSSGYGSNFFAKNGFQSWELAIGDVNDGARWLVSQGVDAKRLGIVGWSYGGYAALQASVMEPSLYRATVAIAPVTDLTLMRKEAFNRSNYKLVDTMIGEGPHVIAGSPARNAAKITVPVLMFHGDKDLNVDINQSRVMVSALRSAGKSVEFVEYKGLDHQIDDTLARTDMLSKSAAFLDKAMK